MLPRSPTLGAQVPAISLAPLLLASASILGGCTGDPAAAARALVDEAEETAREGQELEAAKLLRSRVESLPPAARSAVWLGAARHFHRAGLLEDALKCAQAAIASGKESPEPLYLEGDSLRRLGRLEEGQRSLEKLLQLEPGNRLGQLSLAEIRFRALDPASALPLFESYLKEASPGEARYEEALLEHGRALRAAGHSQEAADRFVLLLEKDPLNGPLYSELASSLYRLRLREEARFVEEIYRTVAEASVEEELEKTLRENGVNGYSLAQSALNSLRAKRFLGAYQGFRRAVEVAPRVPLIRIHFSELCLKLRRLGEARSVLEGGLRLGLRPISGIRWMEARLNIEERDFDAARRSIRKAEEALQAEGELGGMESGQAPPSLHLLAVGACLEAGDREGAGEELKRAEAGLSGSWELAYCQGRIRMARGDAAGAAALFAAALQNGGASSGGQARNDLHYWNGLALEASGRREEALEELSGLRRSSRGYLPLYEPLFRLESDPEKKAALKRATGNLTRLLAEIRELERAADRLPMERCAQEYLKLARLYLRIQEPSAFNLLFLLADLMPREPEVLRLLLSGTTQLRDLFVRIHLLRRLLELEPEAKPILTELAGIYLKLHVRLAEGSRLAESLHRLGPSPQSYRLLGELALAQGDAESAREVLKRGLGAYPSDEGLRKALERAQESPPQAAREK
jgi:hypothetical protein